MSLNILITEDAELDISEAVDWYEEQQDGLSKRFITEVKQKIRLISKQPEIYPKRSGLKQEAILKIFPFTILFRVVKSEAVVYILAVYHTSRNPRQKFIRRF